MATTTNKGRCEMKDIQSQGVSNLIIIPMVAKVLSLLMPSPLDMIGVEGASLSTEAVL